jgi:hypothetical protein
MISTVRSCWEVFRLPEELKKLMVKAALIAIVVLAGGIAGRYLIQ